VFAEDYGITPDGMEDLTPMELGMILDHLDMKAEQARKDATR